MCIICYILFNIVVVYYSFKLLFGLITFLWIKKILFFTFYLSGTNRLDVREIPWPLSLIKVVLERSVIFITANFCLEALSDSRIMIYIYSDSFSSI